MAARFGPPAGVSINTIQRLTCDLREACLEYQDNVLCELNIERDQCDETWNFCDAKDKNVPDKMRGEPGVGSMWTWIAMCAYAKLVFIWQLVLRRGNSRFAARIALQHATQKSTKLIRLTRYPIRVLFGAPLSLPIQWASPFGGIRMAKRLSPPEGQSSRGT